MLSRNLPLGIFRDPMHKGFGAVDPPKSMLRVRITLSGLTQMRNARTGRKADRLDGPTYDDE